MQPEGGFLIHYYESPKEFETSQEYSDQVLMYRRLLKTDLIGMGWQGGIHSSPEGTPGIVSLCIQLSHNPSEKVSFAMAYRYNSKAQLRCALRCTAGERQSRL